MRRQNKKHKIVAFLFSIILIGIGYAYLTTNLKITGTTKIGNARFDVHFKEAEVLDYYNKNVSFDSNSNSNIKPGTPIIKGENNSELEWNVTIDKPGAYYYFAAEIVNAGNIDAKLDLESSILKIKIGDEDEQSYKFNDVKYSDEDTYFYKIINAFETSIWFEGDNYQYINAGDSKSVYGNVILSDEYIENEEWENIRGKEIKITLDLKYIQGDSNPHSNDLIPSDFKEGTMKVRVDNAVASGAGPTTTFPSNSNSNSIPTPTIVNKSLTRSECYTYSNEQHCAQQDKTFHSMEYEVIFNSSDDYYEYSFDVINEEDYDIKLEDSYGFLKVGAEDEKSFDENDIYFWNILDYIITDDENTDYYSIPANSTAHVTIKLGIHNNFDPDYLNRIKGRKLKIKYILYYQQDFHNEHGSGKR